jgi:propanol-preferring alcohol dehydrogenase
MDIASTMTAVQLTKWESPPEINEVPVPEPGPGEVLLQVAAAGLCHSDLHLMEWPDGLLPYDLPFTLGHENAGYIAALGSGVTGLAEGEAVIVYGPWGCGSCWRCAQGMENVCERVEERRAHGGGLGRDGGLAEYLAVPSERLLIPIGDLDPVTAAPLTDAGLTPYHAIKHSMPHLLPGSTALVIGIGGLGHMAIQMLGALTAARIIAVDPRAEARALAAPAGAHVVIPSGADAVRSVRAETPRGAGASVVLDFVGSDETTALAAAVAAVGSQIVLVGLAGGRYPMAFGASPLEASVVIPNWGTRSELIEVVALARAGVLDVSVERIPLEAVPATYRRLARGEVTGRAVAIPSSRATQSVDGAPDQWIQA